MGAPNQKLAKRRCLRVLSNRLPDLERHHMNRLAPHMQTFADTGGFLWRLVAGVRRATAEIPARICLLLGPLATGNQGNGASTINQHATSFSFPMVLLEFT